MDEIAFLTSNSDSPWKIIPGKHFGGKFFKIGRSVQNRKLSPFDPLIRPKNEKSYFSFFQWFRLEKSRFWCGVSIPHEILGLTCLRRKFFKDIKNLLSGRSKIKFHIFPYQKDYSKTTGKEKNMKSYFWPTRIEVLDGCKNFSPDGWNMFFDVENRSPTSKMQLRTSKPSEKSKIGQKILRGGFWPNALVVISTSAHHPAKI